MKEIQHILLHSSMTAADKYIRRLGGANDMCLQRLLTDLKKKKQRGK